MQENPIVQNETQHNTTHIEQTVNDSTTLSEEETTPLKTKNPKVEHESVISNNIINKRSKTEGVKCVEDIKPAFKRPPLRRW